MSTADTKHTALQHSNGHQRPDMYVNPDTKRIMSMQFPDPEQKPDFFVNEVPVYQKPETSSPPRGDFGRILPLEEYAPLTVRSALELFKKGHSANEVTETLGISKTVTARIRHRYASVCDQWREKTHARLMALSDSAMERLHEQIGEMGPRDISIATGILLDKLEKFSSIQPQNSDSDHSGKTIVNIQNIFNSLPKPPEKQIH